MNHHVDSRWEDVYATSGHHHHLQRSQNCPSIYPKLILLNAEIMKCLTEKWRPLWTLSSHIHTHTLPERQAVSLKAIGKKGAIGPFWTKHPVGSTGLQTHQFERNISKRNSTSSLQQISWHGFSLQFHCCVSSLSLCLSQRLHMPLSLSLFLHPSLHQPLLFFSFPL